MAISFTQIEKISKTIHSYIVMNLSLHLNDQSHPNWKNIKRLQSTDFLFTKITNTSKTIADLYVVSNTSQPLQGQNAPLLLVNYKIVFV